jgi:hypothetical protein
MLIRPKLHVGDERRRREADSGSTSAAGPPEQGLASGEETTDDAERRVREIVAVFEVKWQPCHHAPQSANAPLRRRKRRQKAASSGGSRLTFWLRELKGVLSSDLESVILKATRPDDMAVKAKHIELLLTVSHHTPVELDPFQPVLRCVTPPPATQTP